MLHLRKGTQRIFSKSSWNRISSNWETMSSRRSEVKCRRSKMTFPLTLVDTTSCRPTDRDVTEEDRAERQYNAELQWAQPTLLQVALECRGDMAAFVCILRKIPNCAVLRNAQ